MISRARLHLIASRLHKWLALFAGLQIILWFASGAYMSFMPIEQVRGEHLVDRQHAEPLPRGSDLSGLPAALARHPDAKGLELGAVNGKVVAVIRVGDGTARRVDPATGATLPALDGKAATWVALNAWMGAKPIRTSARWLTSEPGDYRGALPVWQVQVSDGDHTRIYVSPDNGHIAAVRTDGWRVFDFFWGLHIMDWSERENSNSPWLFGFAVASLMLALAGVGLLLFRWPLRLK